MKHEAIFQPRMAWGRTLYYALNPVASFLVALSGQQGLTTKQVKAVKNSPYFSVLIKAPTVEDL